MDLQERYNQYWKTWHESERTFYKLLRPTQEEIMQKTLKSQLEEANLIKEVGNSFFKQQDYPKATDFYLKAIEKAPENQYLFYFKEDHSKFKLAIMTNLSMCFLKNKQFNLAVLQCKEGLKQFPLNVKLRYIMGNALGEAGEYEDALLVLNSAKDIEPGNKDVREKISLYAKAFSEYKKQMKNMFGGKLNQGEIKETAQVEEVQTGLKVENEIKEDVKDVQVAKDNQGSWIPAIISGALVLGTGLWLLRKLAK